MKVRDPKAMEILRVMAGLWQRPIDEFPCIGDVDTSNPSWVRKVGDLADALHYKSRFFRTDASYTNRVTLPSGEDVVVFPVQETRAFCSECRGKGTIRRSIDDHDSCWGSYTSFYDSTCGYCNGTGFVLDDAEKKKLQTLRCRQEALRDASKSIDKEIKDLLKG